MRRLSVLVLCAVCFAVPLSVGCGGGEDPQPDAGTPPPPPPDAGPPDAGPKPDAGPLDLQPPTVVLVSPADLAEGVPPESLIEITFSETMQTDRGTLQISPGTGLPNNGVITARSENWDVTKKKVVFQFPSGLPVRAKLTVNVTNFADVAGNPLRGLYTFSFTVSDGQPPRVTSSSPAEAAASVSLTTNQVSFNFSEPMDIRVGTLTPGTGLTLGGAVWTGNQVITAPITSTLVYNANYSVTLSGFKNLNAKDLDGAAYLGDGKLDFGTGPDTTPPTVVSSSPSEGATGVLPENIQYVVINFSEPMDTTVGVGKADLYQDGAKTATLTPIWSNGGFTVSYDVQFQLRYSAAIRVLLTGFKDKAGLALNGTPYLGDGAVTFSTGADTVKPYVISSIPAEGEEIYPVEVYSTGGSPATAWRKIFTFQFSENMNTSVTRVTLHEKNNPSSYRILDGIWSANQRTLTVTVYPPATGQLPLIDDYFLYYMDLTQLKDPAGNLLDAAAPVLSNGRLDFVTLPDSPLLNHACEHALLQTPISITASGSYSASSPATDQQHTRYKLTLPSNGTSFTGHTKLVVEPSSPFTLFTDRDVDLTIADPALPNSPITVSKSPVREACAGITHRAVITTPATSTLQMRSGPSSAATYHLIIERGDY